MRLTWPCQSHPDPFAAPGARAKHIHGPSLDVQCDRSRCDKGILFLVLEIAKPGLDHFPIITAESVKSGLDPLRQFDLHRLTPCACVRCPGTYVSDLIQE